MNIHAHTYLYLITIRSRQYHLSAIHRKEFKLRKLSCCIKTFMFINDSVVVGVYFSSTSVSALINILLFYNGNVTQGKKPREGMY